MGCHQDQCELIRASPDFALYIKQIGIVIQYLHSQLRYNATQTKTLKPAADMDI